MGRYVLITNIWGYKPKYKYGGFDYKDWKRNNSFILESEKAEFDSLDEAKEYIQIFTDLCSTYERPEKEPKVRYSSQERGYIFDSPNKRLYGYLLGDRETKKLTWGFDKLYHHTNKSNTLELYDILFRGPDEIPKDYEWDIGEYEGWLQYRWGDGKNAIDYVELAKPEKPKEQDNYDWDDCWALSTGTEEQRQFYLDKLGLNETENDKIENEFLKEEDIEKLKRLENRW